MKPLFRGFICGVIGSITINLIHIFDFFYEISEIFVYSPFVIMCIIVSLLTVKNNWKSLFMTILFMFIAFLLSEIIIVGFGVLRFFHQLKYGTFELSMGSGILAVMLYGLSLSGSALGTVIACVITAIRIRKVETNL